MTPLVDTDDWTDAQCVQAALGGLLEQRHRAFEVLLSRYQGVVRALLISLCGSGAGDVSRADDLAQETFVTAWLKLNTLQQPQAFAGWIKQLAYRKFLHAYRRAKVEHKHAEILPEEPRETVVVSEDLASLLALCSPLEQELMVLFYAFEFTHTEIAQARQMAVGTVKSLIHRAKRKMQNKIQQQEQPAVGGSNHE